MRIKATITFGDHQESSITLFWEGKPNREGVRFQSPTMDVTSSVYKELKKLNYTPD